jgi:hypothetical protein
MACVFLLRLSSHLRFADRRRCCAAGTGAFSSPALCIDIFALLAFPDMHRIGTDGAEGGQVLEPSAEITAQLAQIRAEGLHGTPLPPPPLTRRGVDVLGPGFDHLVQKSARIYRKMHSRLPDLIAPKTFTEKQLLFKFFGPIPMPSPSDKLRSCAYLPPELRSLVKLPSRYSITDRARVPTNEEVAPGSYFFKSNHSSRTNTRVHFPINAERRAELQALANNWITRVHSRKLALWWYEVMPRNLYLEEDLGSEVADAPDWKFFVCNGRVEIFQVDVDRSRDHVQTLYERNGTFIPQELYYKSGTPVAMTGRLDDMIAVAEGIGRNFDFIRVDLFLKDDQIVLGEIGLVPNGAGVKIRSDALDERLGAAWHAPWLGKVPEGYPGGHYDQIRAVEWEV